MNLEGKQIRREKVIDTLVYAIEKSPESSIETAFDGKIGNMKSECYDLITDSILVVIGQTSITIT